MATIRTLLQRIGAQRLATAAVLLLGHSAVQATGCRLEFVETSPLNLQPASSIAVSLRAVDSGVGACTLASYAISVSANTTAGTLIAPLTGNLIGNSAPQTLNVTAPAAGGGTITWQAACVSGCEAATPPNPTLTVNILGGPRELTLLGGTPTEAPPGAPVPVAVRVTDGGIPAPSVAVNWAVVSGGGSVQQANTPADATGLAPNVLLAPPVPGPGLFRATRGDDPLVSTVIPIEAVVYSLNPGAGATATVPGTPLTLQAVLSRQAQGLSTPSGAQVLWQVVSGPAGGQVSPQNGGLTSATGVSSAVFLAPLPGTYVVQAGFSASPLFPPSLQSFTVTVGAGSTGSIEVLDAPAAVFSEDTTAGGIEVLLSGPVGNGAPAPLANAEVSFYISSGEGGFGNGSGLHIERTDASGRARSPSLIAGRSTNPIVVEIASPGLPRTQAVVGVRASRYRIEARPQVAPFSGTYLLNAQLWRQGAAGVDVPVVGGQVTWSAGSGQLADPDSRSDAQGVASNRFTPGAPGVYEITARFEPGPGLTGGSARFRVEVAGGQLRVLSGDGQRAPAGTELAFPIVLQALRDGAPESGVPVRLGPVIAGLVETIPAVANTDSQGRASFRVRLSANAQGEVALRGLREDSGAQVDVRASAGTAPAQRRLEALGGNGQSGVPGSVLAQPLLLAASDDGRAAPGVRIQFSVQPEGVAEILPGADLTGADGRLSAQVRLTSLAAGPLRVLATRSDDPSASAEFTLFAAVGGETSLQIEAGDAQVGVRGARGSDLVVRHTVNGRPAAGISVQWSSLSGPARPLQTSSLTDAEGRARVPLEFGSAAGSSQILARINADLEVRFRVETIEGALQPVAGNNQSAAAGSALAQPLVVRIEPRAAGIPVEWRVLSGGGRLSETATSTDANGEARARWTLGLQPGPQTVGVRLAGGIEQVFTAQAGALPGARLEIVSGNAQRLPPGVDSAPLVVRVLDAAGAPAAGQRLRWSSASARLDAETSTTDASGRASVRARLALPGEARVQATIEGSETRVEFTLNAGLGQLAQLTPRQREIADVLDRACTALAALSTLTPAQRDLLARCGDLSGAAGGDPGAVGTALSQLPNDVGLNLARAGDEAMRGQTGNLDQRQRALRGGPRVQIELGLNTPDGSLPLSALPALAALADGEAVQEEAGAGFERWGAFVNGSLGRGRSRGVGLNPAFDYQLGSVTAGVDYRFSDRFVAGAAVGLNRDSTDLAEGRGELKSRGSAVSAYASLWLPKDAYLDANLSLGRSRFDLTRRLRFRLGSLSVDQLALAETDASLLGGSLALGRDWQHRAWSLGAYLRGQFSRVEYDAFEEQLIGGRAGEGFGLRVQSPRWSSLEGVLGGRASRAYSFDWGVLLPSLLLEYSREFSDDPSRLDARFLADPTGGVFTQSGAAIDQSHLNLGLGVSALFPGGRSGFLQYERRLQDDNISHWLLSIGGRWEF